MHANVPLDLTTTLQLLCIDVACLQLNLMDDQLHEEETRMQLPLAHGGSFFLKEEANCRTRTIKEWLIIHQAHSLTKDSHCNS